MKGLRDLLLAEQARLEHIIMHTKARLKNAPEGKLRVSSREGRPQFYHCTEEWKTGRYIRKDDEGLIQRLSQKTYDEQVLRLAEKRLLQLKKITKDYCDEEIEQLFYKEHLARQKFIQPVEPTWKQIVEEWKMQEYKGKEFQEGTPVILTEKGERVRSKSEKILADYFFRNRIDYKYECPIYLKGVGIVYPDFTFLSPKTYQETYWEHNGKMDDPVYARKAVRKIQSYMKNDIFPGERLILTYETEQNPLNTKEIERLAEKYLM